MSKTLAIDELVKIKGASIDIVMKVIEANQCADGSYLYKIKPNSLLNIRHIGYSMGFDLPNQWFASDKLILCQER